jgi:hypothetical protein
MSTGIIMVLVGCLSLAAGSTALIFWTVTWPGRYDAFVREQKEKS